MVAHLWLQRLWQEGLRNRCEDQQVGILWQQDLARPITSCLEERQVKVVRLLTWKCQIGRTRNSEETATTAATMILITASRYATMFADLGTQLAPSGSSSSSAMQLIPNSENPICTTFAE